MPAGVLLVADGCRCQGPLRLVRSSIVSVMRRGVGRSVWTDRSGSPPPLGHARRNHFNSDQIKRIGQSTVVGDDAVEIGAEFQCRREMQCIERAKHRCADGTGREVRRLRRRNERDSRQPDIDFMVADSEP